MKKILMYPLVFCLMLLNVAAMCDSDDTTSTAQESEQVTTLLLNGTWKITTYNDNGNDLSGQFENRVFDFNNDNTVTVTLLGTTLVETSTCFVTEANENSTNPDDIYLNFGFESPSNLAVLFGNWEITSFSATTVTLYDPSGVNGAPVTAIFTKI